MTTDACNAYNHASTIKGHAPVLRRLSTTATHMIQWLKRAFNVHVQRRSLPGVSEQQLHDIGLERIEADREASRSFWDLPTDCPSQRP